MALLGSRFASLNTRLNFHLVNSPFLWLPIAYHLSDLSTCSTCLFHFKAQRGPLKLSSRLNWTAIWLWYMWMLHDTHISGLYVFVLFTIFISFLYFILFWFLVLFIIKYLHN